LLFKWVNLYRYSTGHVPPTPEAIRAMVRTLTGLGTFTTVRHEMGQDIAGACGQLALNKGGEGGGGVGNAGGGGGGGDIEDLAGPTRTTAAAAGAGSGGGGGSGGGAALRSRAKSRKPDGVALSASEAGGSGSDSARRGVEEGGNFADGATAATTSATTTLATSKQGGWGGVEAMLVCVAALSLMVLVAALAWKTLGID
jgi:hypothetical protein